MGKIHISANQSSVLGRMFTRIDSRLGQTGSMEGVRRKFSGVIRMALCVCNSTTIFWLLDPTTRRSRSGISRVENAYGPFEAKSTFCLRGHKDWVNAVRVDSASRTVFSASD